MSTLSISVVNAYDSAYLDIYQPGYHRFSKECNFKCSSFLLNESGTAENKEELLFSHDKLLLASILRPLHQSLRKC